MKELQERVLEALDDTHRHAFRRMLEDSTLEEALSRLRRIAALVRGHDTVDGLTAQEARNLDSMVCKAIVLSLTTGDVQDFGVRCLAAWAARANYHMPIELFTVNYDLLLETALEQARATYFDGFVGNIEARFQTELVEATPRASEESMPSFLIRLWKLHGSLNWVWTEEGELVRIAQPAAEGRAAAIYPSDAKYEESRRVPFVVLQDRLRRSLNEPETLVLICGYSFGDEHLNEVLFDSARRRERSEYIAFCFDGITEKLAKRASLAPNLQVVSREEAILGGMRGQWKEPEQDMADLWDKDGLALCDFNHLARYLARSTVSGYGAGGSLSAELDDISGFRGKDGPAAR
ncbi:MAG: SIR2 family protein [Chloroflexota bacterium]|nr:SIR2 family protein [Chloroflexota bacterium]